METIEFSLKEKGKKFIIFSLIIIFIVIFSSLIFASFQTGTINYSIEKIYGPFFDINGWINISFDQESLNSTFSSFFNGALGNSIGLKELLDKNPAYTYSCSPLNCEGDYLTLNGENSKSFALNSSDSRILGLKISSSQPIKSLPSFSMNINSNASVASSPQLLIDILNNNETNWKAHTPREEYQGKNYGCFEESEIKGLAEITTSQYCQKVTLPVFPQVKLGAYVQENSGGNVSFTLSISNESLGIYKSCNQYTSGSGQIECIISDLKTSETLDFFVCIKTKNTADNNKYSVKYEQNEPCGFTEFFQGDYDYDFEIFAQPSLYDPVGNFILNNTEMQNSGSYGMIENKIFNYITEKYGGDCSNECIIPIVFKSNIDNQVIEVSDVGLSYIAGISATITTIHDLVEDSPKINSDYQRLFINKAGFSVPSDIDSYNFSLNLNNQEILSENIEVKNIPIIKSLTPKSTAVGFPEIFEIEAISPTDANLTGYKWDFGDNSTLTTPVNKAVHFYTAIGIYDLKATVTDSNGFNSSKIFEINVSSPKNFIQNILNKLNVNYLSLKEDIQNYGFFQQKSLNSILNMGNKSYELEKLEQEYNAAVNESEYTKILGDLLEINIPENIFKTKQANSFLFFPEKNNIEMDISQAIEGKEYDVKSVESYKQAVMIWQQENIELEVDFIEFSGESDSNINPLVNIFEIKVNEKKDITSDYYMIIPKLENIGFEGITEAIGDFVYINLRDISSVNFYTTEDVDFETLPAFIAPTIDQLDVKNIIDVPKKDKLIIFILSMVFLVIAGFVAYIIIYQWYKKKYEKYLFKNRNDLYNIITYVNDSKKRKLNNNEVSKNLRKAGWNSEQIRYVMRKYEGKRTGLVEIPLVNIMKKVKKNDFKNKQKNRRNL